MSTTLEKWKRVIIHADMDAFYASVEQLDFPEYRGKPVVVGADPKQGKGRGVVSAASYEAREFGIHSAMPISQAYRRCPHAVFRPVRGHRYEEISRRIMAIFHDYTPLVEAISLDEAFLDMTGMERLQGDIEAVGRSLKERIAREEDLTVSIGIGPNKLIAKIASDFDKPDGFVVIRPDEVESFLFPMPLRRLWGIGKKTAARMQQLGLKTIGDFAALSSKDVSTLLGKNGVSLWELAHGCDSRRVIGEPEIKSISNERTFEHDEYDVDVHRKTILFLAEKVGYRLRKKNLCGRTITVKVRLANFETFVRNITLSDPICLSNVIYIEALKLYQKVNKQNQPVRLLGVGVSNLTDSSALQTCLFEMDNKKLESMTQALDDLKKKFGESAIGKGSYMNPDVRK